MQAKLLAVFGLTGLLLQGCAEKQVAPVAVPEAPDEIGHAAKCEVIPNPVVLTKGAPVQVKMVVGNDGGWCAVRMDQEKTAILEAPPQHGTPYFRNVRDLTRLQYTPAPGYTGADSFTFRMLPSGVVIHTTVTVNAP